MDHEDQTNEIHSQTVNSHSESDSSYSVNETVTQSSRLTGPTSSQLLESNSSYDASNAINSDVRNNIVEKLFGAETRERDQNPKNMLKRKVLKLQHEGKIKTMGRGLERDLLKLIFKGGDVSTQIERKEEIENEIEEKVNTLRKVNVVLDHLKKKWDVETMKVRVNLEKELQLTRKVAVLDKDRSIAEIRADEDHLKNKKMRRAGELQRMEREIENVRGQIKEIDIYLVSFHRALNNLQDSEMSSKKFKSVFISMYDQFLNDNVPQPLNEFMRREQLLKRVHAASCKRMGTIRSKSVPAQNRRDYHNALYFSIIELQNVTSQLTSEKVKRMKNERAKIVRELKDVTEEYHRLRELLRMNGVDVTKYETGSIM